jgi:F-box/leucine-rich repeat protein 7
MVRTFDLASNPTRPIRPSPLTASTIQGLPLDLLDRLRSFPLFLSAPDSFLAAIGTHLKPQMYQSHDYILTEGEPARAMYWLVRGAVRVTSRDGESTYAELKPGAFFGEIGILMDIPRTATIIANMRSLVVRLNKEDLRKELPNFPDVERAIMEEAKERLSILERKKKEIGCSSTRQPIKTALVSRNGKRTRDPSDGDVVMGDSGSLRDGEVISAYKKRKSPSPGLAEAAALSAFGSGSVNVRLLLKELPLFSSLPPDILHFIGLNAQPRSFPPFTDIIQQGTQGRDVYFIVRGEVEVVNVKPEQNGHAAMNLGRRKSIAAGEQHFPQQVKARLRAGQYFGEVVSLSLAPRRTATVRSISSVECLMISGDVLNELWQRCTPDVRSQVEATAKERLQAAKDADTHMAEASHDTPKIDELAIADIIVPRTPRKNSVPTVTFSDTATMIESPTTPTRREEKMMEPYDPDPFLNVDLDNVRSRSRRGSLAPPPPDSPTSSISEPKSPSPNGTPLSPSPIPKHSSTPPEPISGVKRPKIIRRPSRFGKGVFSDPVLINVFKYLDVYELMQMRQVSMHWLKLITTSPDILHTLDLTKYNRRTTDRALVDIICPFVGSRPTYVNISNCFHVTDEGFSALANTCGPGVRIWRMKSVWDITGPAVLDMVQKAKLLEEVDLSNCRKVGDNLLARVIGWVVPELPPAMLAQQAQMNGRRMTNQKNGQQQPVPQPLPPGTIVGCPKLRRLTLSYCKHITDRSMAHIAVHAANRIEQIDLTRCTTITDVGFQHWSVYPFPRLTKLCLADCTYLTDNAIVYLTNAAKGLRELDLVSSTNIHNIEEMNANDNTVILLRPLRHSNGSASAWPPLSNPPQPCLLR